MKRNLGAILIGFIALLIVASLSLFVVDQRQNILVVRLGEVVKVRTEPGLYFKVPFLDNIRVLDTRILTIDTAEPERFLTSEKKNVLVDLFVKWRITDARLYFVSVGGDEARARTRLLRPSTRVCVRNSAIVLCTKSYRVSATRSWISCAKRRMKTRGRSACKCSTFE